MAYLLLQDDDIQKRFPSRAVLQLGPDKKGEAGALDFLRRLLIQVLEVPYAEAEKHVAHKHFPAWCNFMTPVLLVVDDVWSAQALDCILSALPDFVHPLVTCRDQHILNHLGCEPIQLNFLTEEQEEALFLTRVHTKVRSYLHSEDIRHLVQLVCGHTGCLVALAGQVNVIEDLPLLIKNLKENGLSEQNAQHTNADATQIAKIASAVYALSWNALSMTEQQLLLKLADLPVSIPLTRTLMLPLMSLGEDVLQNSLHRLVNLGLVTTHIEELTEGIAQTRYQLTDWTLQQLQSLDQMIRDEIGWANQLIMLANELQNKAGYIAIEPLYQRALIIQQQHLGQDHPDIASTLNNLALLYYSMGRYIEAEPLYQRALTIRQQHLSPEHLDTAKSLNDIGLLYYSMGRYIEAEPLYQKALAIHEKQLGREHSDTASIFNNLALLYYSLGRYAEAEPLYQKALAIHEQQSGLDHPDTASILNNLAQLYKELGKYLKAEPLHKRALAIREQYLESDHPDTAISINNLGLLYYSMDRYTDAEPLHKRALAIREKRLGLIHPSTATSLNNLALLYDAMNRYDEAKPLYQKALAIKEQCLEANHPSLAASLNNLAQFYRRIGLYKEAKHLYQRAFAIYEQQFGPDHFYTNATRNNLATLQHLIQ